jgi:NAD+ kinase
VTFGIAGNLEKVELPRVVELLLERFRREKVRCVIHDALARSIRQKIQGTKMERSWLVPERRLGDSCDMLISLGGDGTILRYARLLAATKTPILGVNLGKLGFLAEVSLDEINPCLDDIFRNEYTLDTRMMLESQGNGMKGRFLALNDIVVAKYGASRVMDIETYVNDDYLATFQGDGIIISTPTGSTAYALANGGPIVTPRNRSVTISPICPHTLTARPVIVPDDSTIVLKVHSTHAGIQLTADGQQEKQLGSPATVTVRKSPYETRLVKTRHASYYELLRQKLHWAADVRVKPKEIP